MKKRTVILMFAFILLVIVGLVNANVNNNDTNVHHTQVEIGKPVQWSQNVISTGGKNVVSIHKDADSVEVLDENWNSLETKVRKPSFFSNIITGFATASEPIANAEFVGDKGVYRILYETPAPEVEEWEEVSEDNVIKGIRVSSEIHYEDILTYVDVDETIPDKIRIVHKKKFFFFSRDIDITDDEDYQVEFLDLNGNGFVDRVKWITPHLSTEEFEVSLTVFNVQSYPVIGENWTVAFSTIGTNNLSFKAINDTLFGEDIIFENVKCGDEIVNASFNGTEVVVKDYFCEDIGYYTVKVLTYGRHDQFVRFGDESVFVRNQASDFALSFYHDAACSVSRVVNEDYPAHPDEPIWARFSWTGENQFSLAIIGSSWNPTGACTTGDTSGCFAYATIGASPQCVQINSENISSGITDFSSSTYMKLVNGSGDEVTGAASNLYVNHAPLVGSSVFSPSTVFITDTLNCSVSVSDPDSGGTQTPFVGTAIFTNDGPGNADIVATTCDSNSCYASYTQTLTAGDNLTCNITVSDAVNDRDGSRLSATSETSSITVSSSTFSVSFDDTTTSAGGHVTLTALPESLSYISFTSLTEENCSVVSFEGNTADILGESEGICQIRVVESLGASRIAQIQVMPNYIPTFESMNVYPENPVSEDNLSFYVYINDLDNETLEFYYSLNVVAYPPGGSYSEHSGEGQCVFLGSDVTDQFGNYHENSTYECIISLLSEYTSKADRISLNVSVSDQFVTEENLFVNSFVINNSAPVTTFVEITPSVPNQSSSLNCSYDFSDDDGDDLNLTSIQFKWFINNEGLNDFVEVPGQTDQIFDSIFDKDDLVKCSVRIRDIDDSWLDNARYSEFVDSPEVEIVDNAMPQVIDYNVEFNESENPASVGEFVNFDVSWVDYEDPEDLARIYVCEDYIEEENQYDDGNQLIWFGDNSGEDSLDVFAYSNETGLYLSQIAIKPFKYIRNDQVTYSPNTMIMVGDWDIGLAYSDFTNQSYVDADISDTYGYNEVIIEEDFSHGTPLVYDSKFDKVIFGDAPPEETVLKNFSVDNLHKFVDKTNDGFSDDDDVYIVKISGIATQAGDIRASIVSESSYDSISTEFIYDIIIFEVDEVGEETGTVIARDNDNSFTLGLYNYFTPQYNAQPLQGKKLAMKICIDSDNDDVCDSNDDFMNDSIYVRASSFPGGYNITNSNGSTFWNPEIIFYYGDDSVVGCMGKEYCSTENSAEHDVSCSYISKEDDLWENKISIKACDEHDGCSVSRKSSFFVNHIPSAENIMINATLDGTTPISVNVTSDSNLLCSYDLEDVDNQNISAEVYWYKDEGYGFYPLYFPSTDVMTNGNTRPGERWMCEVIPFDGISYGNSYFSDSILLFGEEEDNLWIVNVSDDSNETSPTPVGSVVNLEIEWESLVGLDAKVYVCNSSSITVTGCWDGTFISSEFSNDNPIVASFVPEGQGSYPYFVMMCDEEWNCSQNAYGNFTLDSLPVIDSVVMNTSDGSSNFSTDRNLWCQYTSHDDDGDPVNPIYTWYRNRDDSGFKEIELPSFPYLTNGNTQVGDEWYCVVKGNDGFADGEKKSSTIVEIGGVEPVLKVLSVYDNSDNEDPTFQGEDVNFSIYWEGASVVKAYICNSSQINFSGCWDRTFGQTDFSTDNPIVVSYDSTDEEVSFLNYWVRICDNNWNCSQNFPLNGSLNFSVNHPSVAENLTILAPHHGPGAELNCSYDYFDQEGDSFVSHEVWWYEYDGYSYVPVASGETLIGNFEYNTSVICSVEITDEYGDSSPEYYSDSFLIYDEPEVPKLWPVYYPVPGNTIDLIGYVDEVPINVSIHARQDFDVSSVTTEEVSYISNYYGESEVLYDAENGTDFFIISYGDRNLFTVGRYVEFSSHTLEYFARYQITSRTDLLDGTYKIYLDKPLKESVSDYDFVYSYDSLYPNGWFNITFADLFDNENIVKINSLNSNGPSPYEEIEIFVDKISPVVNLSGIPNISTVVDPTFRIFVSDNAYLNISTLSVNLTNGSYVWNFSTDGLNENESIDCFGNETESECFIDFNLEDNSSYLISATIEDMVGLSNSAGPINFSVFTMYDLIDSINNGFVDEESVLRMPATLATNPIFFANWTSSNPSYVNSYEYSIREYAGEELKSVIVNWTNVGLDTNVTVNLSSDVMNSMVYRFVFRAEFIDGYYSNEKESYGLYYFVDEPPFCIDCVNFITPFVNGSSHYTNSVNSLDLEWNFESEAEITQYRVTIGTNPYPFDGYDSVFYDGDYGFNRFSSDELSLENGKSYYASIRAKNENNLWSQWVSTNYNITVDATSPIDGWIDYPSGPRVNNVTVNYFDGYDEISDIKKRTLLVSTSNLVNGGCNPLIDFYPVSTNIAVGLGSYLHEIENGKCYRFIYKVTDFANNSATYTKDIPYEIMVDLTLPENFKVTLNNGLFITTDSTLHVEWTPSFDLESGISHYSYAVFEDGNQIGNWSQITNLSNTTSTNVLVTIDEPKHMANYKVRVVAYNNLNPLGTEVESNSVAYLDVYPPEEVELLNIEGKEAGDLFDDINDGNTDIVVKGEEDITCVASIYKMDYETYSPSKTYLTNCSSSGMGNPNVTCSITNGIPGNNTRYIVCEDLSGNPQTADLALEVNWVLDDFSPPGITLSLPYDGDRTGEMVRIMGNASDVTGIDKVWYEIFNTSDESQVYATGELPSIFDGYWDSNEDLFDIIQNVTIRIFANDSFYGTVSQLNLSFIVDNTRPVINFNYPNLDSRFFNSNFTTDIEVRNQFYNTSFMIYSADGNLLYFRENSSSILRSSYDWVEDILAYDDGNYTIVVTADGIRYNEKELVIYFDRTAPVYSDIFEPESPIYKDDSVRIGVVWPNEFNFVANSCDIFKVLIEHNANGSWVNYTATEIINDSFILQIPASYLDNWETISWRVHAFDLSGNYNVTPTFSFNVSNRYPLFEGNLQDMEWPANVNSSEVYLLSNFEDPDDDDLNYSFVRYPLGCVLADAFDNVSVGMSLMDSVVSSDGIFGSALAIENSGENLIENPGFESFNYGNFSSWDLVGVPINSSNSYEGDFSALVNRNQYYYQYVSVEGSEDYVFSAYMKCNETPCHGRLHVDWYDFDDSYLGNNLVCGVGSFCLQTPELTENYTRYFVNLESPFNAAYAKVYLDAYNESFVFFDNVQFEKGIYATTFVDGYREEGYRTYNIEDVYDEGSLAFSIKPFWNGTEGTHGIFDFYPSGFNLMHENGELALSSYGVYESVDISSWNANEWHRISLSWEDGETDLYLDGVFALTIDATPFGDLNDEESDLAIGYAYTYLEYFADAWFDEFWMFDKSLSLSELQNFQSAPLVLNSSNFTFYEVNDFMWFNSSDWVGNESVAIVANDGGGFVQSNVFKLISKQPNRRPAIEVIPDVVIYDNESWSYEINVTDLDGDDLIYYIDNLEIDLSPDGNLNWSPSYFDEGDYSVFLKVCDNREEINSCDNLTFNVSVRIYDSDGDGLSDTVDFISGNSSDITSNVPFNITIDDELDLVQPFIGESLVEISSSEHVLVYFKYPFSNDNRLNLSLISLEYNENGTSINGITLPSGYTKTLYTLYRNVSISTVCIKDNESASLDFMTRNCSATDEYLITCSNESSSPYNCTNESDWLKVEGLTNSAVSQRDGCMDRDGDGYGFGDLCLGSDCDDTDVGINPGASEVCDNSVDEDCDGITASCPHSSGGGSGGSSGWIYLAVCNDGLDNDNDGLIDLEDTGCDSITDGNESNVCVESWSCSDWSICCNHKISRTCEDANNCGSNSFRPPLEQSCLTLDPNCKTTNSCSDGLKNGDETDVDCGDGCKDCALGQSCDSNFDCVSNFCSNGICTTIPSHISCSDGLKNGDETDVDCGGSCGPCVEEPISIEDEKSNIWILLVALIVGVAGVLVGSFAVLKQTDDNKKSDKSDDYSILDSKETLILYEKFKGTKNIRAICEKEEIDLTIATKLSTLYDYVMDLLDKGVSESVIKKALIQKHWPEKLIEMTLVFHKFIAKSKVISQSISYWIKQKYSEDRIRKTLSNEGWDESVIDMAYILASAYFAKNNGRSLKDKISELVKIHRGGASNDISLVKLEKLVNTLKDDLAIIPKIVGAGYPENLVKVASQLTKAEVYLLGLKKKGEKNLKQKMVEKGFNPLIVDAFFKNHPPSNDSRKINALLTVLTSYEKGVKEEEIYRMVEEKGFPKGVVAQAITLEKYLSSLKGRPKQQILDALKSRGWPDDVVDFLKGRI